MTRTQADLLALADQVFIKNYRQQPLVLRRGSAAFDVAVAHARSDGGSAAGHLLRYL